MASVVWKVSEAQAVVPEVPSLSRLAISRASPRSKQLEVKAPDTVGVADLVDASSSATILASVLALSLIKATSGVDLTH